MGTEGKTALAQAQFSMLGSEATFWKHQTTFQWIQTPPRLQHELQRKVLESCRQLSSDRQLRISVTALHCGPPRAHRAGGAREHRSTTAARPSHSPQWGLRSHEITPFPGITQISEEATAVKNRGMIQQGTAGEMVSKHTSWGRRLLMGGDVSSGARQKRRFHIKQRAGP